MIDQVGGSFTRVNGLYELTATSPGSPGGRPVWEKRDDELKCAARCDLGVLSIPRSLFRQRWRTHGARVQGSTRRSTGNAHQEGRHGVDHCLCLCARVVFSMSFSMSCVVCHDQLTLVLR